ncbi:MAG: aldehyde dehydrogenase family protein [Streptosporangiales bacterium]|nr:aldehyde dehydrogenase family protein [Streptosporangiales bacterium]
MTSTQETAVVDAVRKELFIDGVWRPAEGGKVFDVEDPSTGKPLCSVADGSSADGFAALDAATAAQASWAATPPRERGEILRRAYEKVVARKDELGLLMTLEMGKPVAEATGEILYAAEFLRWFAEEAVRVEGGYQTSADGKSRVMIMRQPVGPCLLITPWNFPTAMFTRKVAPALAAGCTAVFKPSEFTPLSALAMTEIFTEAGLPAGVLNVVPTTDAGGLMEPLIKDGRARKLSFTGSTAVGKKLLAQCADNVMRTSMELGGNAPFIVFEDADVDQAVDGAMLAKMRNIGEACTAANRLYVHESVAEEFSRKLADKMGALTVGRGVDDGVNVGPLINSQAVEKVDRLVTDAVSKGATAVIGGQRGDGDGHFYPPTVLTDVPVDADLRRAEIFGPVAPIVTFGNEEELLEQANDTEYGLVTYVFTTNFARALRVCERLESGMVGLNQGIVANAGAPFGGVKHSGLGREGGRLGIEEFLEVKYIATPNPH